MLLVVCEWFEMWAAIIDKQKVNGLHAYLWPRCGLIVDSTRHVDSLWTPHILVDSASEYSQIMSYQFRQAESVSYALAWGGVLEYGTKDCAEHWERRPQNWEHRPKLSFADTQSHACLLFHKLILAFFILSCLSSPAKLHTPHLISRPFLVCAIQVFF